MLSTIRSRRVAAGLAAAGLLVGAVETASVVAEVAQEDGVRVSVAGSMSPSRLPRTGASPVAVSVSAHVVPTRPGALPKLARIAIAINSHGKLRNGSVPVCRLGRIEPSTSAEALAACRSSLVGSGHFSASLKIPEQSPFPSEGKVLVFNGKLNGAPALFAHVYGTEPVPTSYVLPFLIRSSRGVFGTVLEASLPSVTGEWGYVTGVSLDLDRSYLRASCPAPKDFPGASFPLMRTDFGFSGGPILTSTLNRSCKVK
ncbi:MAG TPA: hypothetical protein VFX85_07190 [Solirubrobacterales bacterium]|nr:hypothetical protein [Solirubrobacterales bacterium]